MKLLPIFLALLLTAAAYAADPEGFAMYKASEIQARAQATKLDQYKAGLDRAGTWGNHGLLIVRREGNGAVETHETQVDIITVVSGEGTLVVGGTMVDGKTTAPHEIRGKSIWCGMLAGIWNTSPAAMGLRTPPSAGAQEPGHSSGEGGHEIASPAFTAPKRPLSR
jgi:hypothetical protein